MTESGTDLSTVQVCKDCGLEVANEEWHRMWHEAHFAQLRDIQIGIRALRNLVQKAIEGTADAMPVITVDPTQLEGSKYDMAIWDEVKPNTKFDPALMKRRTWPEESYHRKQVKKQKQAKAMRTLIDPMADS